LTEGFDTAGWLEMHDCEVIVVDLNMPKVDGISLINYVREIQPGLPIIVFTGLVTKKRKCMPRFELEPTVT
jgi:two-component system chemotaxis response regulator CheY